MGRRGPAPKPTVIRLVYAWWDRRDAARNAARRLARRSPIRVVRRSKASAEETSSSSLASRLRSLIHPPGVGAASPYKCVSGDQGAPNRRDARQPPCLTPRAGSCTVCSHATQENRAGRRSAGAVHLDSRRRVAGAGWGTQSPGAAEVGCGHPRGGYRRRGSAPPALAPVPPTARGHASDRSAPTPGSGVHPPDGEALDPAYVSRHFDRLIARHGLRRIRLHDLRHSSASIGLASGESLVEVSRRLGHSSITITADIYSHISPQVAKESAERGARHVFHP